MIFISNLIFVPISLNGIYNLNMINNITFWKDGNQIK